MNIKEVFTEIYPLDEYKKLKEENFVLFSLTILIPLALLFIFFYLYFYPFGYSKEYTITQENILEEQGDISFSQGEGETNGLLHITVDPKLRVRNLFGEVTVKGEDVHILHPNIEEEEMLDVWEYETDSFNVENLFPERETVVSESEEGEEQKEVDFGEYKYSVLDEYDIRDSNTLSFYLRWEPLIEESSVGNQLLLKYENLRIIQHPGSIELRIDEVYDGNMYTYQIPTPIKWEEEDHKNELIAIYSKPTEDKNGYVELVVNSVRIGRVVVSSPYNLFTDYDDLKKYEEPLNAQLVKDLNQERLSLGQELYRANLENSFPKDLVPAVNLDVYYTQKYKTPSLKKKEQSSPLTLLEYYQKPFLNYFRGDIHELRIGYEYPFEKIQSHSRFYGHTPFTLSIAGKTEDIEEITFITTRDPIWR